MEWRRKIEDLVALNRQGRIFQNFFLRKQLNAYFAGCGVGLPQMHRDLRRLIRPEDGVESLDGEAGGALASILGRLPNESYAIRALPISSWRLKIQADDEAAGHRPTRRMVDYDNRRCYQQSRGVDHVAKAVETTF